MSDQTMQQIRTQSAPVKGRVRSSSGPPRSRGRERIFKREETVARTGRLLHTLKRKEPNMQQRKRVEPPTPPAPAPALPATPEECALWLEHWAQPANLHHAVTYFSSETTWSLANFLLPQWNDEDGAVVLGQGGEGVAWLAVERKKNIPVVLKELYEVSERETLIHSALEHEGIVRFYTDFYDAERESTFIVLEFCAGGTLFDALPDEGGLDEDISSHIIHNLAKVLDYLHMLGVVYADLKTSNVLIDARGEMRLSDFGSAHFIANERRKLLKTTGTVDTQPPEMLSLTSHPSSSSLAEKDSDGVGHEGGVRSAAGFDKLVDNWSLGALTYRLVVGGYPFSADVGIDDDDTVIRENILSLAYEFPDFVSDDVVSFVGALLKAEPAERLGLKEVSVHPWLRAVKGRGVAGGSKEYQAFLKERSALEVANYCKCLNFANLQQAEAREATLFVSLVNFFNVPATTQSYIASLALFFLLGVTATLFMQQTILSGYKTL